MHAHVRAIQKQAFSEANTFFTTFLAAKDPKKTRKWSVSHLFLIVPKAEYTRDRAETLIPLVLQLPNRWPWAQVHPPALVQYWPWINCPTILFSTLQFTTPKRMELSTPPSYISIPKPESLANGTPALIWKVLRSQNPIHTHDIISVTSRSKQVKKTGEKKTILYSWVQSYILKLQV